MSSIIRNLDWSILTNALISIIPALFCITIHELAHGFAAYRLGDTTAKDLGRLTLNPIKHIDIFGILMMVVVGFGWAKPVPVNMNRFRNPKTGMAVTSLAGPLSNILLAVVFFFIFGLFYTPFGGYTASGIGDIALQMISRAGTLSVALAIFNILPIPPLDGSKVLFSLLPEAAYYKLMRYERYGMILLIVFVWSRFFSNTIGAATYKVCEWLNGITVFAFNLVN